MHPSAWDLTLVKEYKEKKLKDGISRKRPLINARMLFKISLVMQCVITGNTEKMLKKNWKILYHYASTVNKPKHASCPTDNQGLWGYKRNVAKESFTYKPHGAWAI